MRHHGGAIAAVFVLVVVGARLVSAADPPPTAAPTFAAEQMLAPPHGGWVTNGGTLYNQRYSPLALINHDNVKGLRALWPVLPGKGAATAAKP